jgi:DNA-directed RNA polymerase subunit omega
MDRLEKVIAKALRVVDGDTYLLALLVAKRSEQLSNGAKPLIDGLEKRNIRKPADIALYELAEDKLDFKVS